MDAARHLVETRTPLVARSGHGDTVARIRSECESVRAAGFEVRLVRSIYVPEDDTCCFLLEAPSPELAVLPVEQAGVAVTGVQETLAVPARAPSGTDDRPSGG